MNKKINIKDAKCTKLSFGAVVNFAKKDEAISGFDIDAYTGAAVTRWWGKLVVDVSGILSKQNMPIFKNHDSNQIVGYSTSTSKDSSFRVQGVFSKKTDAAREVIDLAGEGFPWQASIGVMPKTIMEIKEGASMSVNGVDIAGPAEVWSESEVYETSFVPLGADSNTSVAVFSEVEDPASQRPTVATKQQMEPDMDLKELALAELKEKRPDLVALIKDEATAGHKEALKLAFEEGSASELNRVKSVYGQKYPGQEAIVELAMFDGKSQAGDVAMQINAKNIEDLKKVGKEASDDANFQVDEPANNMNLPTKDGKHTEASLKAKWDKDEKLQSEFMGDFELCKASLLQVEGLSFKSLKNRGEE